MSKLFSKPKALLSMVLVVCMVIAMLPAGVINLLAGAAASDTIDVWDGVTIEPFENYYEKDAEGNYVLDEQGNKKPRPGSDFINKDEALVIANAKQLAFFLLTVNSSTAAGDRDTTKQQRPVTFTFNNETYTYTVPCSVIGFYGWVKVKLTADIDMNDVELKSTVSVASNPPYFAGTFDGQDHTVLNINHVSTATGSGFFRRKGYGAVKNVTITGKVTGTDRVGGIAGEAVSAPTFENCAFIGTITATGGTVGGIVGRNTQYNNAPILYLKNCYTAGTLTNTDTSNDIGGLVGYTAYSAVSANNKIPCGRVEMTNCYSAMQISCKSSNSGGLYGRSQETGVIEYTDEETNELKSIDLGLAANNCHFSGSINQAHPIAVDGEPVTNTFYKKGSHTGTASGAAGAVEYTDSEIDAVVAALNSGVDALEAAGVTGLNRWMAGDEYPIFAQDELPEFGSVTVGGAEVDLEKYPTSYALTVPSNVESIDVAATAGEVGRLQKLTAVDSNGTAVVINNGTVALAEGNAVTVTITVWHKAIYKHYTVTIYRATTPWNGTDVSESLSGSGTSADPWLIASAADLYYLAKSESSNSGKYFELIADIDLGGKEFIPIGLLSSTTEDGGTTYWFGSFLGHFDGNDHTVYNLKLTGNTKYTNSNGDEHYARPFGFFSRLGSTDISNLHLVNATINDDGQPNAVGGFASYAGGVTMTNCSFDGTIYSGHTNFIGGLVGYIGGSATFTDCWTTGSVTTAYRGNPAGLLGSAYSAAATYTFDSCWSSMKVENTKPNPATYFSAGLVGTSNDKSTLKFNNCYFAGTVSQPYPITRANSGTQTITLTNVFHKEGCYTGEALGEFGEEKSAADFASASETGVTALLNAGEEKWTLWNGQPVRYSGYDFTLSGIEGFTSNVTEYAFTSSTGTYTFGVDATDGTRVLVSADKASALTSVGNTYTVTTNKNETVVVSVVARKNGHQSKTYTITISDTRWNGQSGGGYGTAANPYQIADAEGLFLLAQKVKDGTTYKGEYFELTADIDLGNKQWTPIGISYQEGGKTINRAFAGTFNGKGHTITGLYYFHDHKTYIGDPTGTTPDEVDTYIDPNYTASYKIPRSSYGVGLFGRLSDGALLDDVHVVNGHIETDLQLVGGLVGYAGTGNITLRNCSYTGKVISGAGSYTAYLGGLIGQKDGGTIVIDNCYTGGNLIANTTNVKFAKTSEDALTAVTFKPEHVGGFIGYLSNSHLTLTNSYSTIAIGESTKQVNDGTGGLVGTVYAPKNGNATASIDSCYYAGSIVSGQRVGGFVGQIRFYEAASGTAGLTITNSYSLAQLAPTSSTRSGIFGGVYYGNSTGHKNVPVTIENCYYYGTTAQSAIVYDNKDYPMALTVTNTYCIAGPTNTANAVVKSAEEFANGTVAKLLGTGWATSTKGYPIRSTLSVVDDALVKIGTSIRTFKPTGMRFYFKVDTAAQIAGLKEYGAVLSKADNAANGLFVGGAKTAKAIAFDGETTVHVREDVAEDDKTYDYFTALLNFSSDKNFNTHYIARAYALYVDEDGQEIVVYSDVINSVKDDDYNGGEPVDSTLYNVAKIARADKQAPDYYPAEEAYLDAIIKGSTKTLNNTYYKLEKDKTLNVAYLGGSVTDGHGSTTRENCWRRLTTKWLEQEYPNATINEVNGAIGGTGTLYGAHRVVEHLKLATVTPDLVFVEFASNDYGDYGANEATARSNVGDPEEYMESIIRTIYQYAPKADIVMVFITKTQTTNTDFWTKKAHRAVAEAYGIPTIDVGARLYNEIVDEAEAEGKEISEVWSKYFTDSVHPTDAGYKEYADYVIEYLDSVLGEKIFLPEGTVEAQCPETAVYSTLENPRIDTFDGFTLTDANITVKTEGGNITFPKGLISTSTEGATFTFKFKGTDLWFWLYGSSTNVVAGKLEVVIDGGEAQYFEFANVQNHKIIRIAEDLSATEHTVTVTLKKNSAGNANLALHYIMMQGVENGGIYDVQ